MSARTGAATPVRGLPAICSSISSQRQTPGRLSGTEGKRFWLTGCVDRGLVANNTIFFLPSTRVLLDEITTRVNKQWSETRRRVRFVLSIICIGESTVAHFYNIYIYIYI